MKNQIEIMDRRRKQLLTWILIGFGVWYGMFLLYGLFGMGLTTPERSIVHFIDRIRPYYFYVGACAAAVSGFFLIRWGLYKRNLMKNQVLKSAVDDERVKQAWLKAFRFAFGCLLALILLLFLFRIVNNFFRSRWLAVIEGMGLHFLLYTAVVSSLGAFLGYNREDKT